MSVSANEIINEAKRRLRDPNATRLKNDAWLDLLNATCRDIASRRKVAEYEAFGDVALDDRYPYPVDCVRLRWVRYSATPSDLSTFDFVREEVDEDQWRMILRDARVGEPTRYFARQGFFQLDATPAAAIAQGLWIAYWGFPEAVTSPSTEFLPLPDFFRDHVRDGMMIGAKGLLGAEEEANVERMAWLEREQYLGDIMQDRSEDERDAARPATWNSMFEDQV